MYNLVI